MVRFPEINWNAVMPQLALVTAGFFLLVLSMLGRRNDVRRGATMARAASALSILGIALSGYMVFCQWDLSCEGFGGMIRIDPFSTFFNLLLLAGALLCILLSSGVTKGFPRVAGEYYALVVLATFGMMVMVSAVDLVAIFIGLETMSLAVYILVGIRRDEDRVNEAALKYYLMGSFASGFLIYGIAMLYGATGTTSLKEISVALAGAENPARADLLTLAGLGLVMVGALFKVAAVPFHMWVPDAYEGAPTPVTAFMAVAVKAAAFGVLVRVLVSGLLPLSGYWVPLMYALSVVTMTLGNLAAVFQGNIKRMLAYSSIAHAGYLLIALASLGVENAADSILPGDRALGALLFYLAAYTLMNVGAFGVLIYMERSGRPMETLDQVRGAGYRYPLVGAAMGVFMLSLAGVPPTGGFMAKFYIFSAAVDRGLVSLAVIGVLNSAVSVYYYLRVLVQMFMQEGKQEALPAIPFSLSLCLALAISVLGILYLGLIPAGILAAAGKAALFLP